MTAPTDTELTNAADAWAFWERELSSLIALLRLLQRRWKLDEDGRDAIWAEWAFRLPRVVASYDPSRGTSLRTHVFASLKWYAHKLRANYSGGKWGLLHRSPVDAAKRRHADVDYVDTAIDRRTLAELDAPDAARRLEAEEVRSIMDRLDPYYRALLHLRFTCEQTHEELVMRLALVKVLLDDMFSWRLKQQSVLHRQVSGQAKSVRTLCSNYARSLRK